MGRKANVLLDMQKKLFLLSNGRDLVLHQKDLLNLLDRVDSSASRMLLSRAVSAGVIVNPIRRLYIFTPNKLINPSTLYKVAQKLRSNHFNYLSLESVLSQDGLISQLPMDRITVMTSGRSQVFILAGIGVIEFTHTKKDMEALAPHLSWDDDLEMFRVTPAFALKELKRVGRNLDLVKVEDEHDQA
jgi:hypothetical protein